MQKHTLIGYNLFGKVKNKTLITQINMQLRIGLN